MYSLLLVDDELFVLNGLKRLIEKLIEDQKLPPCDIRTAQNGLDAIELMKKSPADIIFTDIKMPHMDGIELIERLAAQNVNCKIIILSGFDSFEYAQKAIANNIKAYLLKPVTKAALEETFLKVLDELTREADHTLYVQQLEKQLTADLPLLREKFFFELSNGNYHEGLASFLQLNLDHQLHQIVLVAPDTFKNNDFSNVHLEKDKQLILLQLSNELPRVFSSDIRCTTFQLNHRICSLLSFNQEQSSIVLEKQLKQYQEQICKQCSVTCSIGVSCCFGHIQDFSVHLEEAFAALKQRMFTGKQSLVFYSDVFPWQRSGNTALFYDTVNKTKIEIYHALRAGQKDKVLDILNGYQHVLQQSSNIPLDFIRTVFGDFATVFMMYAFEQNIDTARLLQGMTSPVEAVFTAATMTDMFSVLNKTTLMIFECINEKTQAETSSLIQKIKRYVWTHIADDITLEALSDVVFLTPNYISTLFKKETGISFKDYVVEMKIQRAKELLQSNNLKIHEVAEAVGYHSSTYFSKIFKKVTGMYPSDYRAEIFSVQ